MDMLEDLLAQLAAEENARRANSRTPWPGADHPVSVSCLESHYLKCLIAYVREKKLCQPAVPARDA